MEESKGNHLLDLSTISILVFRMLFFLEHRGLDDTDHMTIVA